MCKLIWSICCQLFAVGNNDVCIQNLIQLCEASPEENNQKLHFFFRVSFVEFASPLGHTPNTIDCKFKFHQWIHSLYRSQRNNSEKNGQSGLSTSIQIGIKFFVLFFLLAIWKAPNEKSKLLVAKELSNWKIFCTKFVIWWRRANRFPTPGSSDVYNEL